MIKSKFQISGGKLFNIKPLGKQGRLSGEKKVYQYHIFHSKIILRSTKYVNIKKKKIKLNE